MASEKKYVYRIKFEGKAGMFFFADDSKIRGGTARH